MSKTEDQRVPWWGLLIEGEAAAVAPLVANVIARSNGDLVLVPGKGWTGLKSLRHDEPDRDLADALRATGREVIILEWGEPESLVWRWSQTTWVLTGESPTSLAEERGVYGPGSGRPTSGRPVRFAALIEGASFDEVVAAVVRKERVMATPRGPVVTDLEEEFVSAEFAERPGVTVYRVTTYLDTGEFRCGIVSHDRDAVYHVPQSNESVSGIPIAPNVDGETDPRAIVRRLQMPEDYLFPTEKWPSSTSRRR